MKIKNDVKLTDAEKDQLNKLLSKGNTTIREHNLSKILLALDGLRGTKGTDEIVAKEVNVSSRTITRIKKKFKEGRLEDIFRKKCTPRMSRRKFDGDAEAKLIALCCGEAPEGRVRWTLKLLADKMVSYEVTETVSYETIRRTLKKMNLSLG